MHTERKLDVTALLKDDHSEVKALFKEFHRSHSDQEKGVLAQEICEMLTVHSTCEEELVYPAARDALNEDDQELVNEAAIEHATAKDLIGQVEAMAPGDQMFDATVKVLGDYVAHHIKEEEGELFPKIRKTDLDLDDLGRIVLRRKEQLTRELATHATHSARPKAAEQRTRDDGSGDSRKGGTRRAAERSR